MQGVSTKGWSKQEQEEFYRLLQQIEQESLYQPVSYTDADVDTLLSDLEDVEYDNAN